MAVANPINPMLSPLMAPSTFNHSHSYRNKKQGHIPCDQGCHWFYPVILDYSTEQCKKKQYHTKNTSRKKLPSQSTKENTQGIEKKYHKYSVHHSNNLTCKG